MTTPLPMLPDTVTDDVLRAFSEAVRERLMRRDPVTVPGLGTFEVHHTPSRAAQDENDRRMLMPPADHIVFEPVPDASHA